MKKILLLLLSVFSFAAFFVSAETTVLWEGLFNEFETDNLLCGLEDPFSGYVIDKMTANCAPSTGDEPFGDEFAIVEDAETGNKLLKVCRKSIGEDSKGCRGVRTKLCQPPEPLTGSARSSETYRVSTSNSSRSCAAAQL